MNRFEETLAAAPVIITEGAVIERLNREDSVALDPHVLHTGFVYADEGRAILERIYRQYLDIGRAYGLPMIVFTPTWRASPHRLEQSRLGKAEDVNRECALFMHKLRSEYEDYADRIFIGGLMGCHGDAYDPSDALSTAEAASYHPAQARALADAGVDFLMAATLPSITEAIGVASAYAACNIPYIISFVIRPNGTLLDATPLSRAVAIIDKAADPAPTCYLVNCVHPTVFEQGIRAAVADDPDAAARVAGLQANTSAASPEELDGHEDLQTEDPDTFADAMLRVHESRVARRPSDSPRSNATIPFKPPTLQASRPQASILGGCCGTDHRHIEQIARRLVAEIT